MKDMYAAQRTLAVSNIASTGVAPRGSYVRVDFPWIEGSSEEKIFPFIEVENATVTWNSSNVCFSACMLTLYIVFAAAITVVKSMCIVVCLTVMYTLYVICLSHHK